MDSQNRNTLIVGASSTFGEAIALRLAEEGHSLILTHSLESKYQLPSGIEAQILTLDVVDSVSVNVAIKSCSNRINNLVYSVGAPIEFTKFKDEKWNQYDIHFQTQVKGLWNVSQALLTYGHPIKKIIVIGSTVTFDTPPARLGPYTTAKYALLGFVKSLAVALKLYGIAVNMISPGATGKGLSKDFPRFMLETGGVVSEQDVASVVVSLLGSKENRTGENVKVEGKVIRR